MTIRPKLAVCLSLSFLVVGIAAGQCPNAHDAIVKLLNDPAIIQQFQDTRRVDPTKQSLRVIAFDHGKAANGIWTLFRWTPPTTTNGTTTPGVLSAGEKVELQGGIPQVPLRRGEPLVLVVTDTNPMLYALNKDETTLAESPDIANLKAILESLTSAVQTALGRPRDIPPFVGATPSSTGAQRMTQATCAADPLNPPAELAALKTSVLSLNNKVDNLAAEKRDAIAFLRQADERLLVPGQGLKTTVSSTALADIQTGIDSVASARTDFMATPYAKLYGCPDLVSAAKAGVEVLKKDTVDPADFRNVQLDASLAGCESAAVKSFIGGLKSALNVGTECATRYLVNFLNTSTSVTDVSSKSVDLLSKRSDFVTAAAALTEFARNAAAISPNGDGCAFSEGVLVSYRADDATFGKVATAKFKLTSANPIGGTFDQQRETGIDHSYTVIDRGEGRIGYGIGLVYTAIKQPTWDAVKNPLDATQNVVARTKESPRAGDLALFGNYRFGKLSEKRWVPGIQFGAGASSNLELFLGLAIEARILRIGIGETVQQVDQLRGQKELRRRADGTIDPSSVTVVGAKADIQTRSGFSSRPYISVTLSLDGFSFIQKKQ